MTITPEYADRHGWMLDTSSVPWLAYRGPKWAPYATAHCAPQQYAHTTYGFSPTRGWFTETTMYDRSLFPATGT